jgi:hypothetical protein
LADELERLPMVGQRFATELSQALDQVCVDGRGSAQDFRKLALAVFEATIEVVDALDDSPFAAVGQGVSDMRKVGANGCDFVGIHGSAPGALGLGVDQVASSGLLPGDAAPLYPAKANSNPLADQVSL